jgi:hypothetical protein
VAADKLITLPVRVKDRKGLSALVDPGSYLNLMDAVLAKELGLTWRQLPPRVGASTANGTSMTIYGIAEVEMSIQDSLGHELTQNVPFLVADLRKYPIYLGMPWVADTNPKMDYKKKEVYFRSKDEALLSAFIHIDVEIAEEFQDSVEEGDIDLYVFHVSSEEERSLQILPEYYSEYKELFSSDRSTELPSHGPQDLAIELEPGLKPPYSPLYNLSSIELAALRKYINDYLARGWIRRSRSPAGAPILFTKKKDGSLRLYVDYRGLNRLTVKNRHALPLISESLDRLSHAK